MGFYREEWNRLAQSLTIKKGFSMKHLVVMALGNIIGSGIFLASGAVISLAGPASALAYAVGGLIMFLEVMFIAEMSIVNPAPGSFRVHASEVFGPGMGFVNGWMFWSSGVLGMASEVTAAAIFTALWFPKIPLWVFSLIYAVIMTLINFKDVRGLSKVEMWLASIKVVTLVAFVLFGFLVVLGILPIRTHMAAYSFSSMGGFFPHGVKGLFASLILAIFSFTGTGIVGLAIADTDHPEKNVPPAIYIISISVTLLYVLSISLIVLLVPWNTISVSASPFVSILQSLGIPFAFTVLNIIVLTASLSGLNSAMYSASRMLYSLSRDKQGPALFLKMNKNGVPVYALTLSSLVLAFTALLSYFLPEKIFIILTGASSFLAMFNWLTICVTHLLYRRKVLKEAPGKLKFKVPGYPIITILAIILVIIVLASIALNPDQIVSLIGGVVLIGLIAIVYFGLKYTRVVK